MDVKKRGLYVFILVISLIVFSSNVFSSTCTCSMYRDTTFLWSVTGVSGANNCSISCYAGSNINPLCTQPGDYFVELNCPGDPLTHDCTPSNPGPCSVGPDDQEIGKLTNFLYYDSSISFACDSTSDGMISPGLKQICAYDPFDASQNYDWEDALIQNPPFRIYDINSQSTNIISNTVKWFYCNASGNRQRYPITAIGNRESFDLGGVTANTALGNQFQDYDGDGCSDFNDNRSVTWDLHPVDNNGNPCDDMRDYVFSTSPGSGGVTSIIGSELCQNPKNCLKEIGLQNTNQCSSNSDCSYGQTCSDSVCYDSCSTNADCSGDYTCIGGICMEYFILQISPVNESFICYEDNGNDYLAECCAPGRCYNSERISFTGQPASYDRAIRAFGNGAALRSIRTFDEHNINYIENNVAHSQIYGNSGFATAVPSGMNASEYSLIVFDLSFNIDKPLLLYFSKGINGPVTYVNVLDYIQTDYTFVWHRVIIPLSEFDPSVLSIADNLNFRRDASDYNDEHEILIDNIHFVEGYTDIYYCSSFFGKWVNYDELDDPHDDANKWACKGIPSFDWTGTMCCGNEGQGYEFANDEIGGCWGGYPIMDENTGKNALNEPSLKDLLYANESFRLCNFTDKNPGYTAAPSNPGPVPGMVQNQGKCSVPGDIYFCDFNDTWSDQEAYGYIGDIIPSGTRDQYKTISPISSDMINTTNFISTESCCPADFCWDGNRCVDGRANQSVTGQGVVPKNYIYLAVNASTTNDFGVVCSQGIWEKKERKFSPHHDYSGYCWLDSQCYYKDGQGNEKCWNSGEIVNDGSEYTDFVCDNGNWSSRTKLLAETMLEIGKTVPNSRPFTLFCDEALVENSINAEFINFKVNEVSSFREFSVDVREGQKSIKGGEHSVCVLAVDANGDGIYGSPYNLDGSPKSGYEDLIIMGAPMANPIESYNANFWVNISTECNNQAEILSNKDKYIECKGGLVPGNFWYNNDTKTIIFSEQSIPMPCGQTTCSLLKGFFQAASGWVQSFLGLKNDADFGDIKAIERANSSSFAFSNILYNHLYYYRGGSKKIIGVKDLKDIQESDASETYTYIIYTEYKGFNLDICEVYNIGNNVQFKTHKNLAPGFKSELTCGASNSTLALLLYDNEVQNNFWSDFTARTRPR